MIMIAHRPFIQYVENVAFLRFGITSKEDNLLI